MRCVLRKLCLYRTTTLALVPAGRTAFQISKVPHSKIALAIVFTIFPVDLPFNGQVFTGLITLRPTSVAKTFWYRRTFTTSAVAPDVCPTIYSKFATKHRGTEATRTHHTSINLSLGFAPLSPFLGNSMVGLITSSSGVPFQPAGAARLESSMMNLTQTANPAVHGTLRDKTAQRQ